MGCGGSKNAVVPSVGSSQAWSERGSKPSSAGSTKTKPGRPNSTLVRVKSSGGTPVTVLKPDRAVSRESLRGTVRGVSSATSKASAHTFDSGLEADYGNIITEESDPALVEQTMGGNRPHTPDLTLQGTQIDVRKRSGKARGTDQDIISQLKNEGLLSRPVAGQSGLAFDVMIAPEFGILKKPPARLAKLKKKKTKKRALTKEELEAKLKSAEERRKRKEAQKLEKLNTAAKEKQVHQSLDASEEAQKKEVAIRTTTDMEKKNENKEARLQAFREKQEKRKAHAEKVRLARLARQAEGAPTQDTDASSGVPEGEASAV
ncbi:stathmin domain-containing protein 1-like [Patiria miniata]|uniref:Stathmin n=1 Tax=Patiria miniata TaxID=46514 RepID=A0A914A198_PATMI|nr:stathmin domain-containing protein 1-like [Patiria miniata]